MGRRCAEVPAQRGLRPWLSVIAGGDRWCRMLGRRCWCRPRDAAGWRESCRRGWDRGGGRWQRTIRARSCWISRSRSRSAGTRPADVAVLRAQPGVFGRLASDPTVSRLIAWLAEDADAALAAITAARATARERVWSWAGAPVQDGWVVIDLDATLVTAHSDQEDADGRRPASQAPSRGSWAVSRHSHREWAGITPRRVTTP